MIWIALLIVGLLFLFWISRYEHGESVEDRLGTTTDPWKPLDPSTTRVERVNERTIKVIPDDGIATLVTERNGTFYALELDKRGRSTGHLTVGVDRLDRRSGKAVAENICYRANARRTR